VIMIRLSGTESEHESDADAKLKDVMVAVGE
jgi:hypothetical protein